MTNNPIDVAKTPLFLLGLGLIGGSLLTSLLETGEYRITALCRKPAQAEVLKTLGVPPLLGSLDSEDLIVQATIDNDVREDQLLARWGVTDACSLLCAKGYHSHGYG